MRIDFDVVRFGLTVSILTVLMAAFQGVTGVLISLFLLAIVFFGAWLEASVLGQGAYLDVGAGLTKVREPLNEVFTTSGRALAAALHLAVLLSMVGVFVFAQRIWPQAQAFDIYLELSIGVLIYQLVPFEGSLGGRALELFSRAVKRDTASEMMLEGQMGIAVLGLLVFGVLSISVVPNYFALFAVPNSLFYFTRLSAGRDLQKTGSAVDGRALQRALPQNLVMGRVIQSATVAEFLDKFRPHSSELLVFVPTSDTHSMGLVRVNQIQESEADTSGPVTNASWCTVLPTSEVEQSVQEIERILQNSPQQELVLIAEGRPVMYLNRALLKAFYLTL